jgi:hypothetical protein
MRAACPLSAAHSNPNEVKLLKRRLTETAYIFAVEYIQLLLIVSLVKRERCKWMCKERSHYSVDAIEPMIIDATS